MTSNISSNIAQRLRMRICGLSLNKFYSNNNLQNFRVEIIDSSGNIYTDTHLWILNVKLLDGNQNDASHLLKTNIKNKLFVFNDGICHINDVKITDVSSKHYKCFQFLFSTNNSSIEPIVSSELTIISCRLLFVHRKQINLTSESSIALMPHIGIIYTNRLESKGILTIGDLAKLKLDPYKKEVFGDIRKNRGRLTEYLFDDVIEQANKIANKDKNDELNDSEATITDCE